MEKSVKEALMQAMHRIKRMRAILPLFPGVSRGEYFVLHQIFHLSERAGPEKPGAKITDLSVAAEMSKPAISQMLNSLEKKELIERIMAKSDHRVVYVRLTKVGRTQLEKTHERLSELMDRIIEELGVEDAMELTRLFNKLYDILEKVHNE